MISHEIVQFITVMRTHLNVVEVLMPVWNVGKVKSSQIFCLVTAANRGGRIVVFSVLE